VKEFATWNCVLDSLSRALKIGKLTSVLWRIIQGGKIRNLTSTCAFPDLQGQTPSGDLLSKTLTELLCKKKRLNSASLGIWHIPVAAFSLCLRGPIGQIAVIRNDTPGVGARISLRPSCRWIKGSAGEDWQVSHSVKSIQNSNIFIFITLRAENLYVINVLNVCGRPRSK
jgi:hypothetical protein